MKQKLIEWIKGHENQFIQFGDELMNTPELGFKEFNTKRKIIEFLKQYDIEVDQEFSVTGFSVSIGTGSRHLGLMAELDALVTMDHPNSDPITHAAHACGHSTQVVNMIQAFVAIKELKLIEGKDIKLTLFFTPAEEYVDLDYRRELLKNGTIQALAGKQDMLVKGILDGVDAIIHLHATVSDTYRYSVNSTLAGFIYKEYHFMGKSAHAAVAPSQGINALNAYTLFQNAVGLMRETFDEKDMIRVHGMIKQGGQTINSIPAHVIYESYVRSLNSDRLLTLSNQLTQTAMHCAQALNATCEVIDAPGYLPLAQNAELTEIIYQNMLNFCDPEKILTTEKSIASGDIGDVACLIPTIQFGYTGFKGTVHGKDFMVSDPYFAYTEPTMIIATSICDLILDLKLIDEIKKNFKPSLTKNEYLTYLKG